MAIELKQYDGQTVTAQDDAIINDLFYGLNGVIRGCNLRFISVNNVSIEEGWGVIKGRLFKVTAGNFNCMLPDSNGVGIIKIKMDLMNRQSPVQILSEAVAGEVYPTIEQDEECNYNNGTYEIELARYTASAVAITDFRQTFQTLIDNNAAIKTMGDSIDGINEKLGIKKATLAAGAISITISDSRITTDSVLSFYTSKYGVNPTDATATTGSVTLTFDALEEDIEVGVRVDG